MIKLNYSLNLVQDNWFRWRNQHIKPEMFLLCQWLYFHPSGFFPSLFQPWEHIKKMFDVLNSAHFISATVSELSSLQVWDRRCLSTGQAAGVLTGHLHGITHIDSHGDGRSFISNGKDQSIKLWDIRKMMSNADRYSQQFETQVHPILTLLPI